MPPDVLDFAFPPEHSEIPPHDPNYDRAISREIVNQIPGASHNLMQSETDEHEKMTRKLFGEDYGKEYIRRMRQGLQ